MKTSARLLLLCLCVQAVYAITIGANQNTTYMCPAENQTETFFCSAPIRNITLNLEPGEKQNITDQYCTVAAQCIGNAQSSEVCSISKTLDAGDIYEKDDGACDIKIKVRNATVEESELYSHTEKIEITKDADEVRVSVGNRDFIIPAWSNNSYQEGEVTFMCPKSDSPLQVSSNDRDVLLNICAEFAPWMVNDWLRPAMTTCQEYMAQAPNKIDKKELDTCQIEKSECEAETTTLTTRLEELEKSNQDLKDERDNWKGSAEYRGSMLSATMVWAILATIVAAFMAFMYWRRD